MKKVFKRSLACLIAVLMIVSSLPFTAVTANAAETKSASVQYYGTVIKSTASNRSSGTKLTLVNDNQDENFDIGYITFDVDGLSSTTVSNAKYRFNISAAQGRENLGVSLWYPTQNTDMFNSSTNLKTADGAFCGDGSTSNKVDHITTAKNYFGMNKIQDIVLSSDTQFSSAYNSNHEVDISSALQYAINNGKSTAVVCFMLTKNGEHRDSNGWSDTDVNVTSTSVSFNVEKDYTKVINYVKSNIESFNGYTGDASAPADNSYSKSTLVKRDDGISDTMQNVLYAYGTTEAPWNNSTADILASKSWLGGSYYVKTGFQYGNIVFLYDGKNEPSTVIMSYTQSSAEEGGMTALTPQGNDFSCPTRWHSSGTSGNSGKIYSTVKWGYGNGTNIQIGNSFKNSNAYFYNSLHYIGTPTNTITTFSNLTYDITIYSTSSSYNGSKGTITFGNTNTTNGTTSIYIVNYKPIKDAIASMKSVYATIKANGDDAYCESGLNAFYEAAYNIMMFNPNSYDYGSNVSAITAKVGDAIDNLKSQYVATATKEPTKHNKVTSRENEVAATCTTDGSYQEVTKCTSCGKELSRETKTISSTGHKYNDENICTVCGNFKANTEAYDAAVTESESIKNDEKYTAESRASYAEVVKNATDKRAEAKKQSDIDSLTAKILSAQSLLRTAKCEIIVQTVDGNSNTTTVEYFTKEYDYGTVAEIDLSACEQTSSIKGVKKWTVSTDNGLTTTKLSTTDTKLTLYVTKNATVQVYELDEPEDTSVKYSKVVFLGKNGVVVDIKYVKQDETTTPAKLNVSVPTIPFYGSQGWDMDSITGTGETIYVRAKYKALTDVKYLCNVHYEKFPGGSKQYSYDSYVYLDEVEDGAMYALASDAEGKNILTYLEGRDFYAPKTSDIYVVRVENREPKIGITGHFADSDKTTYRWATYNCKFYLPEDCTAIEWGLEVTYGSKTQIIRAENLSKGNEYTVIVRVKETSSITNVSCRSYVTYKQGNETKTIYSDAVGQDF